MVTPVCSIFVPDTLINGMKEVTAAMDGIGISMENPINNILYAWNEDGIKLNILPGEFHHRLCSGEIFSIQCWVNGSEDVFVSWKESKNGFLFVFHLDGLSDETVMAIVEKVMKRIYIKYRKNYGEDKFISFDFV